MGVMSAIYAGLILLGVITIIAAGVYAGLYVFTKGLRA
jgi:hypothetical protein